MKNKDKPAMPLSVTVGLSGDIYSSENVKYGKGITKLEHFTGMALMGILANPNYTGVRILEGMVKEAKRAALLQLEELDKE